MGERDELMDLSRTVFVDVGGVWSPTDPVGEYFSASPDLGEPRVDNPLELLGLNSAEVLAEHGISTAALAWESGAKTQPTGGPAEEIRVFAALNSAAALQTANDAELYRKYAQCESEHPDFTQTRPGLDAPADDAAWMAIHAASIEFARCARAAGYAGVADPAPNGGTILPLDFTEAMLRALLDECLTDAQVAIQVPEFSEFQNIASDYLDRVILIEGS